MDHNYRIMIITSTVSYRGPSHGIRKNLNKKTGCRGQAHYCTNVEKRLCHAVT
ncbi:hypothetical protein [Rickettsia endosymbiont of Ceutorhynchus obstrictus]|uniref:hypothetical protein n=1 Tax=Rickettsia endosymbiont of Ceutorhynchus obstrictus TaxID=3066249 RepID=UPI003132E3B3